MRVSAARTRGAAVAPRGCGPLGMPRGTPFAVGPGTGRGRLLVPLLWCLTLAGCSERLRHRAIDGDGGCTRGQGAACSCDDGALGRQVCEGDAGFGGCDCSVVAPVPCTIATVDAGAELRCPGAAAIALPRQAGATAPSCRVENADGGPDRVVCDDGTAYVPEEFALPRFDAAVLGPVLDGSFTIRNALDVELLSAFSEVEGNLVIDAPGLLEADLSQLVRVGGHLGLVGSSALTTLDLSGLRDAASIAIVPQGMALKTLDLSNIEEIGAVTVRAHHLEALRLHGLREVRGDLRITLSVEAAFSLPLLERVGGAMLLDATASEVLLPRLRYVHGDLTLRIQRQPLVLVFPALEEVGGRLHGYNLPPDHLGFPSLKRASSIYFYAVAGWGQGAAEVDLDALAEVDGGVQVYSNMHALHLGSLQRAASLSLGAGAALPPLTLPKLTSLETLTLSGVTLRTPALEGLVAVTNSCGDVAFDPPIELQSLTLGGTCAVPGRVAGVTRAEGVWVSSPWTVAPDLTSAGTVRTWPSVGDGPASPLPALAEVQDRIAFGLTNYTDRGTRLDCAAIFPALAPDAYPDLTFEDLRALREVDCRHVTHVRGGLHATTVSATEWNFDALAQIDGDLELRSLYVEELVFPALSSLGGVMRIMPSTAERFGAPLLGIPVHTLRAGDADLSDPETLAAMRMAPPALIPGALTLTDTVLEELDLPGIRYVSGGIDVRDNPLLRRVSLPDLRTATTLVITHNVSLAALELPRLDRGMSLQACRNPALAQCYADAIAPLVAESDGCAEDAGNGADSGCQDACCPL